MSISPAGVALPHAAIAAALESPGYIVLDEALPETMACAFAAHLASLSDEAFASAGVGRETAFRRSTAVRRDEICWLEPDHPITRAWFAWMEGLRLEINRRLFLGLFDFECHYARYRPGAFYRKHVDAFRGGDNRVVSVILYLNPHWRAGDGGELLLYTPTGERPMERVEPTFNRMVLFLSTDFPHEVIPAHRTRYSLTGWFRLNGSRGEVVDPPR